MPKFKNMQRTDPMLRKGEELFGGGGVLYKYTEIMCFSAKVVSACNLAYSVVPVQLCV